MIVEVDVLGSLSLMVRTVSVDVKQQVNKTTVRSVLPVQRESVKVFEFEFSLFLLKVQICIWFTLLSLNVAKC